MKEEDIRRILAEAFVHIKEQQDELFEVKNQLAAIRDIMKNASPNFAQLFSESVENWQSQGRDVNAETLARFDEIIQKLRNG